MKNEKLLSSKRMPDFTYRANTDNNTVSVIDNATNVVVSTIPVGALPILVFLDKDKPEYIYVKNQADDTVSVIDTKINLVVDIMSFDDFNKIK